MANPAPEDGTRARVGTRPLGPLLLALAALPACSASSGVSAGGGHGGGGGANGVNGEVVSAGGTGGNGASSVGSGNAGTGPGDQGQGGFISIGGSDGMREPEQCGGETFPLKKKPAKLLLVLDRSGSMKEKPDGATASTSKWELTVPAVNEVITKADAQVSWGLKTFPEGDTTSCIVTDAVDVAIASQNAAKVTAAVTATTPEGNGTPTGDAMKAAVKYLQSLTASGDTDPKYILLATDGEPSCVGGSEKGQADSRPYAVQAVTDAAKAGYHTFVVGVSTTKQSAMQALNDMAVAGGEARADPNPLATKYYLASTKDELVTAFGAITGVILDCRFSLSSAPPDGEHVGIMLGKDRVPPDSWNYSGPDKTTIEVTGAACDQIKSGATESVQIVFGCPMDPIR
jgi:hypothetical protein